MPRKKADAQTQGRIARKKQVLTDALLDFVLEEGLDALALRAAAARLGTSDRMLLYYFGNKPMLIITVLARASERLAERLAQAPAPGRVPPGDMITGAVSLLTSPEMQPYSRLWIDIAARSMRGEVPFIDIAAQTVATWLDWIERRVAMPEHASPREAAAAILAMVDGAVLLELSAPGTLGGGTGMLEGLFGSVRDPP